MAVRGGGCWSGRSNASGLRYPALLRLCYDSPAREDIRHRVRVEESQMAYRYSIARLIIVLTFFIAGAWTVGFGQTRPASVPTVPDGVVSAVGITHTILLHSPVQGKVYKIGPDGKVAGEYTVGAKGEDSWILPNGRLLAGYSGGVREIDTATGNITWEYKAQTGVEIHSCQPLPGDRVLICECGSKRLFEINRDLSVNWEIHLASTQPAHKQ